MLEIGQEIICPAVSLTAALIPLNEVMLRRSWKLCANREAIENWASFLRMRKPSLHTVARVRMSDGYGFSPITGQLVQFYGKSKQLLDWVCNGNDCDFSDEDLAAFVGFCVQHGFIQDMLAERYGISIEPSNLVPFTNEIPEVPVRAYYIITNRCNLHCKHCCNYSESKSYRELTTDKAINMLQAMGKNGVLQMVFTGGEPSLRKDLAQLVEVCIQSGMIPVVTTNGYSMTFDKVEELYTSGLRYIQLSLDGSRPAVHDSIRRIPGAFDRTLRAIDLFKSCGYRIAVGVVVTRYNFDDVLNIVKLLEERRVQAINIMEFLPLGMGSNTRAELQPAAENYQRIYYDLFQMQQQSNIEIFFSSPLPYLSKLCSQHVSYGEIMRVSCGAGYETVDISADGNAFACGALLDDQYRVGNLIEENIAELWKNAAGLKHWRSINYLDGKCQSCDLVGICVGGCRALAMGHSGTLLGENPSCWHGCKE